MHYALPQRKASRPPAYAIRPHRSAAILRRSKPQFLLVVFCGAAFSLFLLIRLFSSGSALSIAKSSSSSRSGSGTYRSDGSGSSNNNKNNKNGWTIPAGAGDDAQALVLKSPAGVPNVILVTAFDGREPPQIVELVKRNREEYAARHGYKTFYPHAPDYPLHGAPLSWAKVPALRHAMTLYPQSTFYFYLHRHSLIMNATLSVENHIFDRERIERLMIADVPIVPPDSVIKTFDNLRGDRIDLVISQDSDGLGDTSFLIRRGEWAKFLLDAWFDPIYRSYNFQRAERHALEHIVQWHGTVLAKLALVPQRIINSYHQRLKLLAADDGLYKEGDFVITFGNCGKDKSGKSCVDEMEPYIANAKRIEQLAQGN